VTKIDISRTMTIEELSEARSRIERFFGLEDCALSDEGIFPLCPPPLVSPQEATTVVSQVEIVGGPRQRVITDIVRLYRMAASYYMDDDNG
jgi:hypothetical protein